MATADDDRPVTFQADTLRRTHATLLTTADSRVATARQLHGAYLDTLESSSWPIDG